MKPNAGQGSGTGAFWSRVLGGLAASAVAHPWRFVLSASLLAVLAAGLALSRLTLKTSNLDLVDPDLPPVARFIEFAESFGSPNMLVVVLERAPGGTEQGLREAVERIAPRLARLPDVRTVMARLPYDPARLSGSGVDAYFSSRDRGLYFVFVQPADARSSAATIAPFVEGVRGALAAARLDDLHVRAGLTGIPQYALDDRDVIQRDISRLSGISFAVVLVILALGFQSFRRPLLVMLVLLFVALAVVGLAAIVPGHLTLLSAFFFSALFGLGSDYGIFVLHAMEERIAAGTAADVALVEAVRIIARGLAAETLATAAAFLTLLFSGFRGFAELGFLGAAGVLLALLAVVTLLPALLVLTGDRGAPSSIPRRPSAGPLLVALQCRPLAVGIALAALLVAGVTATGLPPFDGDYTHLQPRDSEAVRLEREMIERSDFSPQFAAFTAADADRAADVIVELGEESTVGAVRSRHDLRQLDMIAAPDRAARSSYERLFATPDGRQAIYAYPLGDLWDPAFAATFLERMRAIDPGVTGMPVLGRFMIDLSKHALLVTGFASGAVVVLILALEFRWSRYAWLAALPTVLGLASTLGTMRALGLALNPLNVMAFPVIIGTAVDAGVHLTERFRAEGGDVDRTVRKAGHTVLVTGFTTLVGFAALIFTSHRGLASFALVLTLGTSVSLVLSLLVLPRALAWAAPGGRRG